jgi:hypothetical protein
MRVKVHGHKLKHAFVRFDAPAEDGAAMFVCCKSEGSNRTTTIVDRNRKPARDAKSRSVLE